MRKNGLGDLAAPRVRGGACVRQRDVELHVLLAARSSMLLPPLVIGSDRKPHVIQLHSTASSMPLSTTASPSDAADIIPRRFERDVNGGGLRSWALDAQDGQLKIRTVTLFDCGTTKRHVQSRGHHIDSRVGELIAEM